MARAPLASAEPERPLSSFSAGVLPGNLGGFKLVRAPVARRQSHKHQQPGNHYRAAARSATVSTEDGSVPERIALFQSCDRCLTTSSRKAVSDFMRPFRVSPRDLISKQSSSRREGSRRQDLRERTAP